MKATLISKENNIAKFTMEFTAEEFEQAQVKVYQRTKSKFVIDGFRKGKAPRSIIEKFYGEGVFFEDAVNDLIADGYGNALDELGLNVIDQPTPEFGDINKGEGFTVTITVPVYPEFEVTGYKGVEIEKVDAEVTAEMVDAEMENLRKRNARMVAVERAAKEGDTVILDYAGFVGEEQFEGGTAERQSLKLGSNTFIPGFEEQLVGVAAGESKDVVVTFPEVYHSEDLAGKEATFKCTVHEVKEEELTELNDDFAKDISEFDTLEELRADKEEQLKKTAAAKSETSMRNAVLEAVYNANDIEIPEVMIEDEINQMMNEFDQQLQMQGMSLEQYFEYLNANRDDFRAELREDAFKRVKTRMIVGAVADAEQIMPSDEDLEEELDLMAAAYQMEKDQIREMLGQNMIYVVNDVRNKLAVNFMFDNAVIK